MTLRTKILEAIKNPAELRRVNEKDLRQVADELRAEIADTLDDPTPEAIADELRDLFAVLGS